MSLSKECFRISENKMPRKVKDQGSFSIPCLIDGLIKEKALADLGASINLMPCKTFKRLGIREPKLTG